MYISDISHCHGNGSQIYPVLMTTKHIQYISRRHGNGSRRHGNGGLICPIVVAICLDTFQEHSFWSIACMTSSLYYMQFNKCICNLTSELIVGLKFFFDLSDVVYT